MTSARVSEAALSVRVVEVVSPLSGTWVVCIARFLGCEVWSLCQFSTFYVVCDRTLGPAFCCVRGCGPFAPWGDRLAYLDDPCAFRTCLVVCPEIVSLGAFESQASSPSGEMKSAGAGNP